MSRSARAATALLAAGLYLLALPALAQEAAPEEPEAPPESVAIPLPEVATRSEEVATVLRQIAQDMRPSSPVESIARALPLLSDAIDDHVEYTSSAVTGDVSLEALEDLEGEWLHRLEALNGWADELTERATGLQAELARLDELRTVWLETREAAKASEAPEATRDRIDSTLEKIGEAREQAEDRRDQILTLQDQGSEQRTRASEALELIRATRDVAVGKLFAAAAPPVWSPAFRQGLRQDLGEGVSGAIASQAGDVVDWADEHGERFQLHLLIALSLVAALAAARRRLRTAQEAGPGLEEAEPVFQRPVETAILLSLLVAPWVHPEAPRMVLQLFYAALLIPAVLLLRRLVAPTLHPALYALVGFFLVDRMRQVLEGLAELERVIFLLELLAAIAILLWLGRPSRMAGIPAHLARSPVLRRAGLGARLGFGALVVALLAGLLGYVRLSRLLGQAVFGSAYAAVILYAAVRITSVLLHFVLRVGPLRRLHMVRRHRPLLERRGDRGLRFVGYAAWAWATLDLLGLAEPGLATARSLLGGEIAIGAVSLSLGDVLAFVLTVWAAFLVSRFLRFVLEEDVFPRTPMRRGMPYALSTLLHYAVLLFGFLLAVAATGVNLDRLAFLAGAFGVGIGFGLQNVVNNFVSGLILLFERPIQRGDTVQVGTLWGEVKRIGIRASVVRTFDGAEVIVPNGNLISEQVTNWTLSDRDRRIVVDVGVAYGTDPERVLEILRGACEAHSEIMSTPAPLCIFRGFGESSLDFQVRAWITDFDRGLTVQSELGVAIHHALAEAGIEIPFPQRDLHLRSADAEVQGLLGRDE